MILTNDCWVFVVNTDNGTVERMQFINAMNERKKGSLVFTDAQEAEDHVETNKLLYSIKTKVHSLELPQLERLYDAMQEIMNPPPAVTPAATDEASTDDTRRVS